MLHELNDSRVIQKRFFQLLDMSFQAYFTQI